MEAQDKKKILLVDDEEEVLDLLGNTLKRHGYEVVLASCGADAIELARQVMPDLIILDMVMPDIYGADVAKALSKDFETKDIPIVFLTGIADSSDESFGIKAGKHYGVLAKPVDEAKLLAAIKEFSRLRP